MADTIADLVVNLEADFSDLEAELKSAAASTSNLSEMFSEMGTSIEAATEHFSALSGAASEGGAALKETADKAKEARDAEEDLSEITDKLKEAFTRAIAEVTGFTLTLEGVFELAKKSFEAFSGAERAAIALRAITGSAANANEAMEKLEALAAKDSLTMPQVVTANQRLMSAGLTLEQSIQLMGAAADGAAAMNASFDETASALRAMVVYGMAAPRMLSRLGIDADALAKILHTTQAQLMETFRSQTIDTRIAAIQAAMQAAGTAGLGAATTLQSAWVEFGKAMEEKVFIPIGEALVPLAQQVLRELTDAFKNSHDVMYQWTSTAVELLTIVVHIGEALGELIKVIQDTGHATEIWLGVLAAINPDLALMLSLVKAIAEWEGLNQAIEEASQSTETMDTQQQKLYKQLQATFAQFPEDKAKLEAFWKEYQDGIKKADAAGGDVDKIQKRHQDLAKTFSLQATSLAQSFVQMHPVPVAPPTAGAGVDVRPTYEQAKADADRLLQVAEDKAKREKDILNEERQTGVDYRTHLLKTQQQIVQDQMTNNAILAAAQIAHINRMQEIAKEYPLIGRVDPQAANKILEVQQNLQRENARLQDEAGIKDTERARKNAEVAIDNARNAQQAELEQVRKGVMDQVRERQIGMDTAKQQLDQNSLDIFNTEKMFAEMRKNLIPATTEAGMQAERDYTKRVAELGLQRMQRDAETNRMVADNRLSTARDAAKADEIALAGMDKLYADRVAAATQMIQELVSAHVIGAEQFVIAERAAQRQITENQLAETQKKIKDLEDLHRFDATILSQMATERAKEAELVSKLDIQRLTNQVKDLGKAYQILGVESAASLNDQLVEVGRVYGALMEQVQGLEAQARINQKILEIAKEKAEQEGKSDDALQAALSNINIYLKLQEDRLFNLGQMYTKLQNVAYNMFSEVGRGFTQAIVQGGNFGDVMVKVMKGIASQTLNVIIGGALHEMQSRIAEALQHAPPGSIAHRVGVFLGGDPEAAKAREAMKQATTATETLSSTINRLIQAIRDLITALQKPLVPPAGPIVAQTTAQPQPTGPIVAQTTAPPPAPAPAPETSEDWAHTMMLHPDVHSTITYLGEVPTQPAPAPEPMAGGVAASVAGPLSSAAGAITTSSGTLQQALDNLIAVIRELIATIQQALGIKPTMPTLAPAPAPAPDLVASLQKLRSGEGGFGGGPLSYGAIYRGPEPSHAEGAYQFEPATWAEEMRRLGVGQYPAPAKAEPGLQDLAAIDLISRRGFQDWSMKGASLYGHPMPGAAASEQQAQAFMTSIRDLPLQEQIARAHEFAQGLQTLNANLADMSNTAKTANTTLQDYTGTVSDSNDKLEATVTAPPAPVPVASAPARPIVAAAAPAPVTTSTPVPTTGSANRMENDAALQQNTQNLRSFGEALTASTDRLNSMNTTAATTKDSLDNTNSALGTTKQQATDLGTTFSVTKTETQDLGDAEATTTGEITAGAARRAGAAGAGTGSLADIGMMASGLGSLTSALTTGKGGPMAIMAGISSVLPLIGREIIGMYKPAVQAVPGETPGGASLARAAAGPRGQDPSTIATQQNTRALGEMKVAQGAALGATLANTVASIANATGNKTLGVIMEGLSMALSVLTVVEEIRAVTGWFQHGGVVPGGRGAPMRAVVHGGELVANESMMRELGSGMATGTTESVIRGISGLTAGSTATASAAARAIGEQLSSRSAAAGGGGTVSFDGAVFHGVPDQRYVSNIMDTAVRSLRNSSRTWAFNPTGQ